MKQQTHSTHPPQPPAWFYSPERDLPEQMAIAVGSLRVVKGFLQAFPSTCPSDKDAEGAARLLDLTLDFFDSLELEVAAEEGAIQLRPRREDEEMAYPWACSRF